MQNSAKPKAEPDWAAIRPRYENTDTNIVLLADEYGVTWQRLSSYGAKHGWAKRKTLPTPAQKAAELRGAQLMPSKLASRLKRLIAREIDAIEAEDLTTRPAIERERDARRLSSLVRSLEKLNEIKARKDKQSGKSGMEQASDEDLGAELERRFARFIAARDADRLPEQSEPEGETVAG